MLECTVIWLGLAYLAIGVAFAWLADHFAVKDLPAWYRRERLGWLIAFCLLWPLCLVVLVLLWRLGGDDGRPENSGSGPFVGISRAICGKSPAEAGPMRWP